MMRKVSLLLAGVAIGAMSATFVAQSGMLSSGALAQGSGSQTYRLLNLFGDVFEKVRSEYVERPDEKKLIEAAINGMLTSLDPHSSYMDAKSFRDMQVQTRGEFGGLGIEVTQQDGIVRVVAPIDDTPAARAGVMAGDLITHIDGEQTQGLTLNQAVDKMRGQIGSSVNLTLVRGENKQKIEVKITRDRIQIRPVRAELEGDDIGFIRITQFNEQTFESLKRAMDKFNSELPGGKLKGFIIDLRNNPGGLLDQSVAVANAFLDRGEIVSTRGKNPDDTHRFNAKPQGDLARGKKIVVLINGGSASASEIVAGALQDHKRAVVIGSRSFGKGSVQTILPLGRDNGALRLTTARYYTPSGRSIQAKGIEPDIEILHDVPDNLKGQDSTKGEAALRGHLKNGENEASGSQAYVPANRKEDKQVAAAREIIYGTKTIADFRKKPEPAKDAAAQPEKAPAP